jgi:hypothetical protein
MNDAKTLSMKLRMDAAKTILDGQFENFNYHVQIDDKYCYGYPTETISRQHIITFTEVIPNPLKKKDDSKEKIQKMLNELAEQTDKNRQLIADIRSASKSLFTTSI